jgi:hypothetical protein
MNKNTLVFGLIAGVISSVWFIASTFIDPANFDYDNGMLYGYITMLIAFAFIFVGVINYRDKFNGGAITFGKAFKVGLYISLIASTIYVVTWMLDYYFFIPDFLDNMEKAYISKQQASGASVEAIEKTRQEMAQYKEWYKNPLFTAALTYTEILPVGLIISLCAAAILKRKPVETV